MADLASARARHRHQRGRSSSPPARLAALDREPAATGRGGPGMPSTACPWEAVSALARRSRGMRGAHRQHRARSLDRLTILDSRSTWCAAARRRGRRARLERGRALRARPPRLACRALPREDFAAVVGMLAEGFSTRRGRRGALIHYDGVNHVLRGPSRRAARHSPAAERSRTMPTSSGAARARTTSSAA